MKISIVVPVFNEVANVRLLHDELTAVLGSYCCINNATYEILYIDDGSSDGTLEQLTSLAQSHATTRVARFRRNFGQTAAMQAGFDLASGDVIVTLDGDLQNDPADIPQMIEKLKEGYDLVHGWRKKRKDKWLSRRLPSKIANWIISNVTQVPIHDLGCTLKVIRREIADELELYGEMHRFIPILAAKRGAKCYEVVTNHRPRQFGESKYGLSRTIRVVLDLLTVKFMSDYLVSPMKLFGRLGFGCWAIGAISVTATIAMKLLSAVDMTGNPLLLLSVLSFMAGLQLFSIGILGELNARIYFDGQNKRSYAMETLIGFDPINDRQTRSHSQAA